MKNSFKADISTINKLVEYYKDIQDETSNTSLLFKASGDGFTLLIYSNFTVLFQGKKAKDELAKWVEVEDEQLTLDVAEEIDDYIDHIGSDEVGVGDYFGPLVVTSAFVKTSDYQFLCDLGVKDSKQLSDNKIREIAGKIKEKIKSVTFVLSNKKYNEIIKTNNYNLNKIKAYLHNFVLSKIVKETSFEGKVIVDQFCSESLYYKYLNDYKNEEVFNKITFTTKAENKYLAVACASIIARDTFLNEIEKIKQETGYDIILGANEKVDKLAKQILDEKGIDFLSNIVKLHFKNTEKIKEM